MGKTVTKKRTRRAGTRTGKKSFLILREDGKVVSFKRFTVIAIGIGAILAAAITASSILYLSGKNVIVENRRLTRDLNSLQQRYRELRDEKDILLARVVIAETRAETIIDEAPTSPEIDDRSDDETPEPEITPKETQKKINQKPLHISIEDFQVFNNSTEKTLKIKLKLVHIDKKTKFVAGRLFVILMESEDPYSWLIMPPTPLVSGRPSLIEKGRRFSIKNYKYLEFTARGKDSQKPFKNAVVFAYANTGELLLEKKFQVTINNKE